MQKSKRNPPSFCFSAVNFRSCCRFWSLCRQSLSSRKAPPWKLPNTVPLHEQLTAIRAAIDSRRCELCRQQWFAFSRLIICATAMHLSPCFGIWLADPTNMNSSLILFMFLGFCYKNIWFTVMFTWKFSYNSLQNSNSVK